MVEITIIFCDKRIKGFKVEGHAGYAKEGEDICCAGVSAVTQTALLGLLKNLDSNPTYTVEKGWLNCVLSDSMSQTDMEKAQLILTTMEAGLISLEDAYSEYIKVTGRYENVQD